jgi:alpha-beta hydrolase superfamily lysophospholipase
MNDPADDIQTATASDGYRWHYRPYRPTGGIRGQVIGLHGIQSHGGWYSGLCRYLAEGGYEVAFLDRRGAGLNETGRGDAPSFRRLLDDVAEFARAWRHADLPLFVVGISWGGKSVLGLVRRHRGLVDGLVLVCPGLFPRVGLSLWERLKLAWARCVEPTRLFPIPLDEPELFTATPRWLTFLREDARALHRATARFLIESLRLDYYLKLPGWSLRLPVLLLLAGQDQIIETERTRAWGERLPSTDREMIIYPEAHHTLEFEPDPSRYWSDVRAWLDRQVAKRGK